MSAFVVDKTHVDALVTAGLVLVRPYGPMRWFHPTLEPGETIETLNAKRRELRHENADEVGLMLWTENVRSIHARYPDTTETGDYPGPADFGMADVLGYRFDQLPGAPDPVVTLKAIKCYEYQSCEHDDWRRSEAFAFCQALREHAIAKLPGYEDAPGWEITDRHVFQRVAGLVPGGSL